MTFCVFIFLLCGHTEMFHTMLSKPMPHNNTFFFIIILFINIMSFFIYFSIFFFFLYFCVCYHNMSLYIYKFFFLVYCVKKLRIDVTSQNVLTGQLSPFRIDFYNGYINYLLKGINDGYDIR